MADLLDEVDKKALYAFKKDFFQLMRVAFWMDREYMKNTPQLKAYVDKYKLLLQMFNMKCQGLFLSMEYNAEELTTRLFINQSSVKGIFPIASRIAGLKRIGANDFNDVEISDSAGVAGEMEKAQNELCLYYAEQAGSLSIIHMEYSEKEKKVELHYDWKGIMKDTSPEFKLVAYYALKGGIDNSVGVYEKAISFGFTDLPGEQEFKEMLDEFNPRFGE